MTKSHVKRAFWPAAAGLTVWAMLASTGFAQPVANDWEIQAGGGFFHAQGSDSGSVSGDVSLGYYLVNPAWELGLRQAVSYTFIDNSRDVWTATTIPFVNYHFMNLFENERVIPFLGIFAGTVWNDQDATGTVGPSTGIKVFLSDQAFLTMRYRYEWFFDSLSVSGVTDDASDGNHVGTIGLGFVWGGKDRVSPVKVALAEQVDQAATRTERAAGRAETAASTAQQAAEKTEAAAKRIERVADEAEAKFQKGLRK